jgi:hypothetical protein
LSLLQYEYAVTGGPVIVAVAAMAEKVGSVGKVGNWAVGTLTTPFRQLDDYRAKALLRRLTAASPKWGRSDAALQLALRPFTGATSFDQEDLVLDFANLDRNDDEQALRFMERYGVFDPAHRSHGFEIMHRRHGDLMEYAVTPPEDVCHFLRRKPHSFATSLYDFWEVQRHVHELLALARAIQREDCRDVEAACAELLREVPKMQFVREYLEFGREVLCGEISRELTVPAHGISLVAAGGKERIEATVTSTTVRPVLFLGILSLMARRVSLGRCENAGCEHWFMATRKSKRYCGKRCQELVKVHRYRSRQQKRVGRTKSRKRVGSR